MHPFLGSPRVRRKAFNGRVCAQAPDLWKKLWEEKKLKQRKLFSPGHWKTLKQNITLLIVAHLIPFARTCQTIAMNRQLSLVLGMEGEAPANRPG